MRRFSRYPPDLRFAEFAAAADPAPRKTYKKVKRGELRVVPLGPGPRERGSEQNPDR